MLGNALDTLSDLACESQREEVSWYPGVKQFRPPVPLSQDPWRITSQQERVFWLSRCKLYSDLLVLPSQGAQLNTNYRRRPIE